VSIAVGVLLATVAVGLAQGPFFPGGFGGGGGPSQLINNPQVREELKITPEQAKKIEAAILKAINDNLEPDQSKRLKQIGLQVRGYRVFADPAVQTELKFTDEQKDTVKTALTENAEKIKELFKEGGFGKETFVKMFELNKETQAKVIGVLTDAQKEQFKEMVGAEFKLKMGMGKGFFKKKDE
jgi:Spy/CpxP family protein refolding chaperone